MIRDLIRIVSNSEGFDYSDLVVTNITQCRDLLSNELYHHIEVVITLSFCSGERFFSAYANASFRLDSFCSESTFLMNGKKSFSTKEDYMRFLFVNLMKGRKKFAYENNSIKIIHSDGYQYESDSPSTKRLSGVDNYLLATQINELLIDCYKNGHLCVEKLDKELARGCSLFLFPNHEEIANSFCD